MIENSRHDLRSAVDAVSGAEGTVVPDVHGAAAVAAEVLHGELVRELARACLLAADNHGLNDGGRSGLRARAHCKRKKGSINQLNPCSGIREVTILYYILRYSNTL